MQCYGLVMALSVAPRHLVPPCLWAGPDPPPGMGVKHGLTGGAKMVVFLLAIFVHWTVANSAMDMTMTMAMSASNENTGEIGWFFISKTFLTRMQPSMAVSSRWLLFHDSKQVDLARSCRYVRGEGWSSGGD